MVPILDPSGGPPPDPKMTRGAKTSARSSRNPHISTYGYRGVTFEVPVWTPGWNPRVRCPSRPGEEDRVPPGAGQGAKIRSEAS